MSGRMKNWLEAVGTAFRKSFFEQGERSQFDKLQVRKTIMQTKIENYLNEKKENGVPEKN